MTVNLVATDTPSCKHTASTTTSAPHMQRDPADALSGCQSPPSQATYPSAAHGLPVHALISRNVDGGDGAPQTGGGPSSTQPSEPAKDAFITSILAEHDCDTELGQQACLIALFGDLPLPILIAFFERLKGLDGVPLYLPPFLGSFTPSLLHNTLRKIGQIVPDGPSWKVDSRLLLLRLRWKAFRLMLLCVILLRDGLLCLDLRDLLSKEVLQTVLTSFYETIIKVAAKLEDENAVWQIRLWLGGRP